MTKTKNEKVLVESFKGFDIYLVKDTPSYNQFLGVSKKLEKEYWGQSIWDIKGMIEKNSDVVVNREVLIKSGYFHKDISKIKITKRNTVSGIVSYKVIESTDESYDVGRTFEKDDLVTFPLNAQNLIIYNKVRELEKEIEKIEVKQRELVKQLSKKEDSPASSQL